MTDRINVLPVPTWNHLGVNWAGKEFSLAGTQKKEFPKENLLLSPLPSKIERIEEFPEELVHGESGIGKAYDDYVAEHANVSCFLKVKESVEQTIRMKVSVSSASDTVIGSYGIYAEEGSHVTLMQEIASDEQILGSAAELTRIYAKKGARVKLIQIQNLNRTSKSWNGVAIYAEDGARVEVIRAVLGGSCAALGSRASLDGKESSYQLDTIYFGDQTQIFDFNDIADHYGKSTRCDMYTAGVLAGKSSKILRGTIDFKRGAVYAAGHETEEVLMLGKSVRNRTVPLILCGEEQVEGQHAATIGRLDETQIYYLCSRGLTPAEARMLLVEGRFSPVLDQIPDEALRGELSLQIERRLRENDPKSNAS